jgi:hypothetical protein
MKLTNEELQYIRDAIVITNRVKYQDFFEEIYDHYINSIEAQMADNKDFQEAFVAVHESFLDYEYVHQTKAWGWIKIDEATYYGLEALQMQYLSNLHSLMPKRHRQLLKSMFQWPTIVTTVLIGVLVFMITDLLPKGKWIFYTCSGIVYFPVLLVALYSIKCIWEFKTKKRFLLNSAKGSAVFQRAFFLAHVTWYVPTRLLPLFFDKKLSEFIPMNIIACLLFWYILVAISFFQLYREQFKIKIA